MRLDEHEGHRPARPANQNCTHVKVIVRGYVCAPEAVGRQYMRDITCLISDYLSESDVCSTLSMVGL